MEVAIAGRQVMKSSAGHILDAEVDEDTRELVTFTS